MNEPPHARSPRSRSRGSSPRSRARCSCTTRTDCSTRLVHRGGEPRRVRDGRDRRARLHPRRAARCALRARRHVGAAGRVADPRDRRRACSSSCSCSPAGSAPRSPTSATVLLRLVARRRGRGPSAPVADAGSPAVDARAPLARPDRRTGAAPASAPRSRPGLDVEYDGVQVLFGVDLDVAEGELVVVLGTNGSGKSTVLARGHRRRAAARTAPSPSTDVDATRAAPERIAALGVGDGAGRARGVPVAHRRASTCASRAGCARPATARRSTRRGARAVPGARSPDAASRRATSRVASSSMLTLTMALVARPRAAARRRADARARARAVDRERRRRPAAVARVGHDGGGRRAVARPRACDDRRPRLLPRARRVRFEGAPADGLLERHDLRARGVPRRRDGGGRRPSGSAEPDGPTVDAVRRRLARRATSGSTSVASTRSTTCRSPSAPARSSASSAATARGRPRSSTCCRASSAPTPARSRSAARRRRRRIDVTRTAAARRARVSASAARSRTVGSSPRSPSSETIAVALEHAVRVRDPVAAALHLPAVARSEARGPRARRRAGRPARTSARTPTSSCTSCRPARAGSSTSRACSRTSPSAAAARRAVERPRAARRRKRWRRSSSTCATARDHPPGGRARPAAAAGRRRAPRGPRPRPHRGLGHPTRCSRDPAVAGSFLGSERP